MCSLVHGLSGQDHKWSGATGGNSLDDWQAALLATDS